MRQGMKDRSSNAAFDWNVTGASICYLGVEVHTLSLSLNGTVWNLSPFTILKFGIKCSTSER